MERVVRRQATAAIILVSFAVNLVAAGLGDHIEQTTGGAAEFGSEPVDDDLEFLHRFERYGEVLGFERAEVFAEEIVGGIRTVDDQAAVIALLAAQAEAAAQTGDHGNGRSQLRQIAIVAALERKILETFFVQELRDAGGRSINRAGSFRSDGDALFGSLQLHVRIQRDGSADVDDDFLHRVNGEVAGLKYQRVLPRTDGLEIVGTVCVCSKLALEADRWISERNFYAGNRGTRRIVHEAVNSSAIECLRSGVDSGDEQQKQREDCALLK